MTSFIIENCLGRTISLTSSVDAGFLAAFLGSEEKKAMLVEGNPEIPFTSTLLEQYGPYVITKSPAVEAPSSFFIWPYLLKGVLFSDEDEKTFKVEGLPDPEPGILYLVDQDVALALQSSRTDLLFPYTPLLGKVATFANLATYSKIK